MSFLFGKSESKDKEQINKMKNLLEQEEEIKSSTITKMIKCKENEVQKYVQVNLQDFVDPQNATIRVKKLKLNIKSMNTEIIKNTQLVWVPIPLIKNKEYRPDDFQNKMDFEDEFELTVTPKMTFYQSDEHGKPIQSDFTCITNFNMLKGTPFTISLGSMYLVLDRKTTGKCAFEVKYTLSYTLNNY